MYLIINFVSIAAVYFFALLNLSSSSSGSPDPASLADLSTKLFEPTSDPDDQIKQLTAPDGSIASSVSTIQTERTLPNGKKKIVTTIYEYPNGSKKKKRLTIQATRETSPRILDEDDIDRDYRDTLKMFFVLNRGGYEVGPNEKLPEPSFDHPLIKAFRRAQVADINRFISRLQWPVADPICLNLKLSKVAHEFAQLIAANNSQENSKTRNGLINVVQLKRDIDGIKAEERFREFKLTGLDIQKSREVVVKTGQSDIEHLAKVMSRYTTNNHTTYCKMNSVSIGIGVSWAVIDGIKHWFVVQVSSADPCDSK